jgi:FkbM family methyltransferase
LYLRDLLPDATQVPVKYWFSRACGTLEREMKLLELIAAGGDRVIDVGGNRGVYAYRLWQLGTRIEVFEPNPVCQRVLQAWAAGKPEIAIHATALSSHPGAGTLTIPVDDRGIEHDASATIEGAGFAQSRNVAVPLRTLDSFDFREVRLIKIDVEGHEYGVIEGAAATLASSRPALLVEIEQRHSARPIGAVFDKITSYGYQGFFLEQGRLNTLEKFDLTRHQAMSDFGVSRDAYINNFLFLHQSPVAAGDYDVLFQAYRAA